MHLGKVIGRCAPKTGIEPFGELVAQVMTSEPYASAQRVYWVVDNGSSHNGARSIERMSQAFPHATLVHLPVHASWIEEPGDFWTVISGWFMLRCFARTKSAPLRLESGIQVRSGA